MAWAARYRPGAIHNWAGLARTYARPPAAPAGATTRCTTMNFPSFHAVAVADFQPAPSVDEVSATKINVAKTIPKNAGGIGIPVGVDGDVPKELGLDRATLAAAGFEGKIGQSLIIPRAGSPALIAVGIGATGRARPDHAPARRRRLRARGQPLRPSRRHPARHRQRGARGRGPGHRRGRPPGALPLPSAQAHDPAGAAARGAHDRVAVDPAREAEARRRARPGHGPGRRARARPRQRARPRCSPPAAWPTSPRSWPTTRGSTSRSSTRRRWRSSAAAACSA